MSAGLPYVSAGSRVAPERCAFRRRIAFVCNCETQDIEKEIADARVLGGMHFRHSLMNGAQLGRKVAKNMVKNYFQKLP